MVDFFIFSNLLTHMESYIVAFFACVFFMIFMLYNRLVSKKTLCYFAFSSIAIILVIIGEMIDSHFAEASSPNTTRIIGSVLAYIARPTIAYFICLVPFRDKSTKYAFYLAIPLILNALISMTAFFCGIAFSYDDTNNFHRGPLGYFSFIVGLFYVLLILLFGILHIKEHEYQEAIICSCIFIFTALSVYFESEFSLKGILPTASIVSEIFYYMFFLMNKYSRDSLTDALLRTRFYHDLEEKKKRYFIMFDINGLKKINDENGHIIGDKALSDFAHGVRLSLPNNAKFYRLGGDEFAIIYATTKEENVIDMLSKCHKNCNTLPFGFSAGYSTFEDRQSFNDAYASADKMLYKEKDAFWQNERKKKKE